MATCISNQAVEITRKDNPGYRAIDAMNETIANIVYEYQRIVESDDAWPSAQYVQDKLRGEPFKASEEQQELYDLLGLSETKTFTSEAQRDAFVEKYLKNNGTWVFPESSVTMYRGVKGDYKLSVGEPLAKNKKATISLNTNSLNITGNEFKNSLFRGQGYEPDIDKDGNLHLRTAYDALSRLRTLSFDRTREGAEQYGHRSAEHPFIIEIDEDFVDTLLPKGEYSREKVENGDRFRYNEEFNEVRLSFDGEIVIPKGKFNIYQTNETLEINNIKQIEGVVYDLQRMEERMEIEENNGASEIFGRLHYNDFKSIYNALDSFLGKYKGYPIIQALYDANAFKYYQHSAGSPVMPSRNYRDLIDAGLLTYKERKMVDSQPNGEPFEYTEEYVDISDELRQHIQHILDIKGNDTNRVDQNIAKDNALSSVEAEMEETKQHATADNTIYKEPNGDIDIHFTKGHNPELSNFAPRSTTIDLSNFRTLDGTKQITFPSVEHAFQYMKFIAVQQMYSRQVKDGNKTKVVWTNQSRAEELQKAAQNVLAAPNGSSAKSKGLALRLTEQEQKAWDSYSPQLMKFLLQQSFAQNKGSRDLLLATGDAKLTHSVRKPDKGPDWSTLFPQFLTEIRESYKTNELKSEVNESFPKITESTGSYRQRTIENVSWSDVTMAFAVDSETAGEKLTRNESVKQKKFYDEGFPRGAEQLDIKDIPRKVKNFINDAVGINADQSYGHRGKKLPVKDIKLNIAGNGIYTLAKYGISQEQINNYITEYIKELINQGVTISEIRSGGQTGVDEAGIIAAQRLGIPCSIHAPKNFIMRGTDGKDISNKEAFISRFNVEQPQATKPNQPVAPESPSIVEQIVNLLRDQGVKVYGKTNLVNFLKNKGDKNIQKYLSKKARAEFERLLLKKRPDMSRAEVDATLDFLHSLPNSKEDAAYVKTAIRWVLNDSIRLPEDHIRARQAFNEARKKHVDVSKYRTLGELIVSDEMRPKEKEKKSFNPNEAKSFSNKHIVTTEGGRNYEVYDVEDNEQGLEDVCKAVSAHYSVSPWCVSTFTATGKPTESAKRMWSQYRSIPKKIAFLDGRPVAFSADSFNRNAYEKGTLRDYDIQENDNGEYYIMQPADGEISLSEVQPLIDEGLIEVEEDPFGMRSNLYRLTIQGKMEASFENVALPTENWFGLDNWITQPEINDKINIDPNTIGTGQQLANQRFMEEMQAELEWEWQQQLEEEARIAEQERAYWAERWVGNNVGYDPYAEIREYQNDETYDKILQNVPFITKYLRDGQLFYPYQEALRDLIRRGYDENTVTEALLNETANSIVEAEDLPFYQTEEGEIYGFIDEDNSMYLDETVITPEHPIHEFTHIWDRIVQEKQPELWKQGIELMRQIDLWDDVLNSEQYGKKWADLTEEERTNRIASEVHSRLTGKEGERILNEIAEKEGKANIISKLKRWLKEVWMSLRETFGSAWTEQELAALTLNDFTQLTLRDLTEGTLKDFLTKQEKRSVISEETDVPIGVKELTELKQDKEYQKDALLLNQFEKLTKEYHIPMSTIDEAAVDIANWISDQISDIMEDPSIAKKIGINISEDEIKTMSRIDVIKKLTPNALFKWCKADRFLHNEDIDIDDIELAQQLNQMADCWDFLVQRSLMTILENEKVAITVGDNTSAMTVTEVTDDMDIDNPADIAEQEMAEETGENQQEWGIENKTVDLLGTATAAVRDELRRCYVLDENGDRVLTDRGVFKRIPMREALNSLQRWVEGSQKLSDAVAKLETKVDKNPWLADLISKLKDPNRDKLQSEMWQVLNAPFINYWIVTKKDGKFVTVNVNSRPALKEAVNNIQAIYSAGMHPLFTLDGVNAEHLKTLKEESELLSKDIRTKVEALQKEGKDISEDEELFKQAVGSIGIALNILGYPAPAELIAENLTNESILNTASVLSSIVWTVDRSKNNKSYNPFAYLDAEGKRNSGSIKGYLNQLLSPLTESLEDTAITCFYDNGKMYQSRVKPSFLTLQMRNFHLQGEEFKEFIRQNYAELPWFRDQDESFEVDWTKGWRNPLLERLITNQDARDHFKHKVQLNFNKKQYMKGMNPSQYIMSSITEFVAGMETSDKGLTYSYIRIPIQSNKPSSEYIMMEVFTGSTYQDDITYRLKMIFDQEMSRISTVRKRNYERGKDDGYIDGFDSVGRKFCFLDFMNYFLDTTEGRNSELGKLLERKLDGKKETQLTPDEESTFLDLATEEIKKRMNSRIERILAEWDKEGITKAAENISKIGPVDQIRETLKKFLWNDSLGAMNIMELFVGDIAFYEDADTLQKRLAELHAPGIRPNTEVKYQGKNITDGKFRAVQLADFELDADKFKSNILENVRTVFERKIAEASDSDKQAWIDLLDHLTNEKTGLFVTDINVTDGQAFNCPTSYMKKARMYGKWSDAQEAVLQKIRKGEKYTWADVKRAFNTPTFATTKPTVYGNAVVDTGVRESGALDKISVPTYFKNSEYTIMLADAILQGEDTGRPNMLRAIFNVMEQSHWRKDVNGEDIYQNDGIDTIQFVSAVKSGVGKTVDLVQFLDKPNGEKLAEEYLRQQIYLDPTNDKIPNNKNYNLHTVRELPFESYAIQMDVSNHFLEHEQIHGSQNRMIIPSELAETDAEGNTVYYDTPQGKKTAKEFGEIYEKTIGANIQQSIKELQEMLGLPVDGSNENQLSSQSTLKKNLAISKILKREIMSNPRYGLDLYFACSIDPETGGFRIPLGDPVQSKRIEQLLNSVIKNKINKQKIAGGPVVQVTNFGTSKNLNIRFKNKNKPGELLMTRSEFFEKNNTTSDKAYKDYIDKNQGGIAHFEVYAAASTRKLFEHFADKDGNIDIGAIEMVNPDLLKMIGYRIPTEAKYSITPMKIVGFLPREAGEAIMMPYEITLLNGSDFDVDKMYLMTKVFDIEKAGEFYDFELTEPNWKAEKRLANQINDFMSNILDTGLENSNGEVTAETIEQFMSKHNNWKGYQEALKKYGEVKKARREGWNQVILNMVEAAKSKYELSEAQKKLINQTVDARKELSLEQKEQDKKDLILKITDKAIRDKAVAFLRGGYRENSSYDDAITREFRKVFLKSLYRTKDPIDTKKARDNQIIDMSWSVLTHETTANELLNPGGFDPQKKMGYIMSILKDPANEGKYNYHDLMKNYSLKELRKLASSNTSLMFFDGQAKYYRQNSAAGSLTGIFAVHRTAHAVLERDNLHIHLAGLLGSRKDPFKPFSIADVDFTDYMKIDTRFDRLGNSIGKILGSLVAAAVDAGKYPVLNLSNINNETANVCVSMIKLGMTFEDTALFLSQKVIDDLLAKHNAENIDGYKSLQSLINEELKELEGLSGIDKKSPLWSDDLSQEDLIDGLLDTNTEHKYRVLVALKKMLKIADAMRLPTAATRYNSISSAVGPQIINNVIAEKKMHKMNSKSFIYTEEAIYNNDPALSVEDIIDLHPILQQFYRANSIAKQVFKGMPTSSNGFYSVISSVVAMGLDDTMFNDTKLMSGLSDFYQTYLLYKTGVVKHSELHHYINEFPTEFITKKVKDKHPDNKLIQAISYNKDKAGRITLEIATTGMDQSAKSPLMSAWWDLYNTDRKLAIDLFKYCIYRGGVGFNPKTFMNLVPVFLKEAIPGYVDTYNKLPQLDAGEPGRETSEPQRILDMFVQNNYNNGKLVTNMTKEFSRDRNLYLTQEKGFTGVMEYSPSDYEKFTDVPYFRLNDKIYKQIYNDKMYHVLKYIELPILGNDRNYVEILVSNDKPVVSTVEVTSDFDNFDMREDSDIMEPNNTFDTADAVTTDNTEDTQTILEKQRDTPTAIDLFIDAEGDPNIGASRYTAWKQAPKSTKDVNREKLDKFFTERLKMRGIQADKKLLDELFNQLC